MLEFLVGRILLMNNAGYSTLQKNIHPNRGSLKAKHHHNSNRNNIQYHKHQFIKSLLHHKNRRQQPVIPQKYHHHQCRLLAMSSLGSLSNKLNR